jgi:hypothetical protein
MELKKTKQPIMGVAALLIILFHLFPVSRSNDVVSSYIRFVAMTGYIGVDIFFFMTGYMAYYSDTGNYFSYIKRKFLHIYPIFIFCCILYVIMGKFSITKALLTVFGIEFILNGGGSMIWFIPAIMIFYLVVPFYLKLVRKMNNIKLLIISLAIWSGLMLALENFTDNHSLNIFLCRLPIILLGLFLAGCEGKWRVNIKAGVGVVMLVVGIASNYNFGYMIKLAFPISDIFYVTAIPYVMGIILCADVIFAKLKSYIFSALGKVSLELYCLQMVFGSLIFGRAIRYVNSSLVAFFIVFAIIFILSKLIHTDNKSAFSFTKH